MSKKIMKRSLALGALMAFVITGSVWAANADINNSVFDGDIFVESNTQGGAFKLGSAEDNIEIKDKEFKNLKPNSSGTTSKGGAIFVGGASVTLEGNKFNNNSSVYWGGAISLDGKSYAKAEVTLDGNNVFKGNRSAGGGAISLMKGIVNFGDGSEDYTLFENNISDDSGNWFYGGGAILISRDGSGGTLNFYSDVLFKNNKAVKDGGAILNQTSGGVINFEGGWGQTGLCHGHGEPAVPIPGRDVVGRGVQLRGTHSGAE